MAVGPHSGECGYGFHSCRRSPNAEIEIHAADHLPPHCHVFMKKGMVRVRLDTLEGFWSNLRLTARIRKCLRKHQENMLLAWENVTIIDLPGG